MCSRGHLHVFENDRLRRPERFLAGFAQNLQKRCSKGSASVCTGLLPQALSLSFLRKCNLRKTCKRDAAEALLLSARDYCPRLFLSLLPPQVTSLSCGSVI